MYNVLDNTTHQAFAGMLYIGRILHARIVYNNENVIQACNYNNPLDLCILLNINKATGKYRIELNIPNNVLFEGTVDKDFNYMSITNYSPLLLEDWQKIEIKCYCYTVLDYQLRLLNLHANNASDAEMKNVIYRHMEVIQNRINALF